MKPYCDRNKELQNIIYDLLYEQIKDMGTWEANDYRWYRRFRKSLDDAIAYNITKHNDTAAIERIIRRPYEAKNLPKTFAILEKAMNGNDKAFSKRISLAKAFAEEDFEKQKCLLDEIEKMDDIIKVSIFEAKSANQTIPQEIVMNCRKSLLYQKEKSHALKIEVLDKMLNIIKKLDSQTQDTILTSLMDNDIDIQASIIRMIKALPKVPKAKARIKEFFNFFFGNTIAYQKADAALALVEILEESTEEAKVETLTQLSSDFGLNLFSIAVYGEVAEFEGWVKTDPDELAMKTVVKRLYALIKGLPKKHWPDFFALPPYSAASEEGCEKILQTDEFSAQDSENPDEFFFHEKLRNLALKFFGKNLSSADSETYYNKVKERIEVIKKAMEEGKTEAPELENNNATTAPLRSIVTIAGVVAIGALLWSKFLSKDPDDKN